MSLRFRYRPIERPEPLGPKSVPVIPLRFVGRNGEAFDTAALLDSGADFSVLFKEHAEILGIDLTKCKPEECQGIGGKVKAWKTTVPVELRGSGEHRVFKLELPVMILERHAENHPLLLGRAAFFDEFEVTFQQKNRAVILKPESKQHY